MQFDLFTDSSSNLTDDLLQANDIRQVAYEYTIEGKAYPCYEPGADYDDNAKRFYAALRGGKVARTSMINAAQLREAFEPSLQAGRDVLFIGMSAGLTGTMQAAMAAAKELSAAYPQRKCLAVDSVNASLGEGIQVLEASQRRAQGCGAQETADWVRGTCMSMASVFTVDDLMYLRRGGRISTVAAVVGTVLAVKPMFRASELGEIELTGKVRGRRRSLETMLERFAATAIEPQTQTVGLAHGDCIEDAQYVAQQLRERFSVRDVLLRQYDLCTGAHVGPGTVAMFFRATSR